MTPSAKACPYFRLHMFVRISNLFKLQFGSKYLKSFSFFLFLFAGKATIITIGGLVAGAVVGSAVENWLQVDIVPFLGIHSPATVVSEFILFSQFLVSLYLR